MINAILIFKEEGKTAIILRGGGMRSAHGAGFMYAFATQLGITTPDIILGSSGDAATALYYSAGQYESIKHIWCELLSTPKFISYARIWKIMNVDYLIDTILKQQDPLLLPQLAISTIQWQIPITDNKTGTTRYISAQDELEIYEVLRATKSIPILFGKQTTILGRKYVDGELGPTLEDHVNHCLELGARRILLLNHENPWTWISKWIMRAYSLTNSPPMRHAIWRDLSTQAICLTLPEAQIICIAPQSLPCSTATRNKEKVTATFNQGFEKALAMKEELHALFSVHEPHRTQEGLARLRDPQGV